MGGMGFKRIEIPGTSELVYAKRVDQNNLPLSLRVYTGINPSGMSRDIGTDAIRVSLFWRNTEGKVVQVGGGPHIKRITTWESNLKKRLDNWLEMLPKDKCPQCGSPMVIRTNKNNNQSFLGCAGYPNCKYTKPS